MDEYERLKEKNTVENYKKIFEATILKREKGFDCEIR